MLAFRLVRQFFRKQKDPAWPPLLPGVHTSFPTLAMSEHDSIGPPDAATVELALNVAARAASTSLASYAQRFSNREDARFYDVFPGEHYRLLAAIAAVLQPRLVVEIGTFTGMSARLFADHMPPGARVVTFDIVPWTRFKTHLRTEDFEGRCTQILCDLSDEANFASHRSLLGSADLIFLDGPKNVTFEWDFLRHLSSLRFERECWLLMDDIRMWNMLGIWRRIGSPRIDLASFGHWCGTGLVHISSKLEFNANT